VTEAQSWPRVHSDDLQRHRFLALPRTASPKQGNAATAFSQIVSVLSSTGVGNRVSSRAYVPVRYVSIACRSACGAAAIADHVTSIAGKVPARFRLPVSRRWDSSVHRWRVTR
jgi:hypothetical protein